MSNPDPDFCPPAGSPNKEWDECVRAGSWTIGLGTLLGAVGTIFLGSEAPILVGTGLGMAWSIKRCRSLFRQKGESEKQVDGTAGYAAIEGGQSQDRQQQCLPQHQHPSAYGGVCTCVPICSLQPSRQPAEQYEENYCDTPQPSQTPPPPPQEKEEPSQAPLCQYLPSITCVVPACTPSWTKPPSQQEQECNDERQYDNIRKQENYQKYNENVKCDPCAPRKRSCPPCPDEQTRLDDSQGDRNQDCDYTPCPTDKTERDDMQMNECEPPPEPRKQPDVCVCPPPPPIVCYCPSQSSEVCTCNNKKPPPESNNSNASPVQECSAVQGKFAWPPLLTFAQVKEQMVCTCNQPTTNPTPICTCPK